MNYETLYLERIGHVAILTLNRPDRMNAINHQLRSELNLALDEVAGEFPDTRVLIITGAGRGFCSGADVSDQADRLAKAQDQQPGTDAALAESRTAVAPRLPLLPQPVIAAVNGVAVGAGLSIALASDIRVASDKARFSSIFIKRAGVPDNGASYLLPALVGPGVAAEMTLTGRIYDAQWAYRVGLVNMVVPADELLESAKSLALEIASNPPLAVRATKQVQNRQVPDLQELDRLEREANAPTSDSEDRREAILSFLEKRPPVYKGR
ncbi:MAG: enoyl-CoA hydratase-related protein [Dehalococcoidia bacterium]|jgi:enoyl-CoA hydratase/carnithine racemase|nr:enoyl-CoA hydratase-related protein [Dehalococcoidia bacterium]